MKWPLFAVAVVLALSPGLFAEEAESDKKPKDADKPDLEITVTAKAFKRYNQIEVKSEDSSETAADPMHYLKRLPGANINNNGPLSALPQMRGMFGPRISTRVDGMAIEPACTNWMDPPTHYMPRALVDSFLMTRGISSVSAGPESIGGSLNAVGKSSSFTDGNAFEFHGSVDAGGRSVDEGFSGGGILSGSNKQHRFHILGSGDLANDREYGSGKVDPTEHERFHYGAGYGLRVGDHELSLDYRHTDTGEAGTPSLPMDILFFDTELGRLEYKGSFGDLKLRSKFYYTDIDHEMDNFSLRPSPTQVSRYRTTMAARESFGADFATALPLSGGELRTGCDLYMTELDKTIYNPRNRAFEIHYANGVRRDLYGVFGEWSGKVLARFGMELGVRYTRVNMDAGRVAPAALQPRPAQNLASAFNAADRDVSDDNIDWVALFHYEVLDDLRVQWGASRKTRSPGWMERYNWLPLEGTAGLSDFNNHVGDLRLKPEVAHEFEIGLDWRRGELFYVSPRFYYRRINDFIYGVPFDNTIGRIDSDVERVSNGSGDATPMRFANTEAEIYGADLMWGVRPAENWYIDSVMNYVRGRRCDISDDLYRIAPPNATLALSHRRERWSATIEGVFYARQSRISKTLVEREGRSSNSETPGYALLNLRAQWRPLDGLTVTGGIDNVFDHDYTNHLNGFNRVSGGDVNVGDRLPGYGRNFFLRCSYRW